MAAELILYGSEYCCLCEQAAALLRGAGVPFRALDIGDDETLIERYGQRVPVLHDPASGAELDWPFDVSEAASMSALSLLERKGVL